MFKWIKYLKELQNITSDVSYLMNRTKDLQNDINITNKRVEKLQRIVECAREDEITYYSHRGDIFIPVDHSSYTYIYMDKKEYKIDQLYLRNPEFIRTNKKDVIMIKDVFCDGSLDYKRVKEYTVDLEHRMIIVTKDDIKRIK